VICVYWIVFSCSVSVLLGLCDLYVKLDFWRCYVSTTKNEKLITFYNKYEDDLYKSKHVALGDNLLL
jgi:hypothetical protein